MNFDKSLSFKGIATCMIKRLKDLNALNLIQGNHQSPVNQNNETGILTLTFRPLTFWK